MRRQTLSPTGQQQQFEVNETFFSTTDLHGLITAGNEVFARTSGYSLTELRGQPHNIIRHPDMPRCVFALLWQAVKQGKSFAGYVKNQAKNGNHYWVFASIVPIPNGYLSVRIKPTTTLLSRMEELYRTLLAAEDGALASGCSESQAASKSGETLAAEVRKLGFPSYDAFSHHALNGEIKSRDADVARRRLRLFPESLPESSALRSAFLQAQGAYEHVNTLFCLLDSFTEISARIQSHNALVRRIAEDFRLDALNVHVASHPLGSEGVAVGTVAHFLSGYARSLAGSAAILTSRVNETSTFVSEISSSLASARIQIEMLISFLSEMATGEKEAEADRLKSMSDDLRSAFLTTVSTSLNSIAQLNAAVPAVKAAHELVHKDIVQLQVAQITGLTEVARLIDAESLNAMFAGLRSQIDKARTELKKLESIVEELEALTASTPPKVDSIQRAISGFHEVHGER